MGRPTAYQIAPQDAFASFGIPFRVAGVVRRQHVTVMPHNVPPCLVRHAPAIGGSEWVRRAYITNAEIAILTGWPFSDHPRLQAISGGSSPKFATFDTLPLCIIGAIDCDAALSYQPAHLPGNNHYVYGIPARRSATACI